jgi:hypothetical protein
MPRGEDRSLAEVRIRANTGKADEREQRRKQSKTVKTITEGRMRRRKEPVKDMAVPKNIAKAERER